jgi:hypothetical protein
MVCLVGITQINRSKMKIQIDTDARTITLEEEVKLGEFFRIMEQLMPNGEWEHFKLKTSIIVVNQNTQPIIVERYAPNVEHVVEPNYPWYTTTGGTDNTVTNVALTSVSSDTVVTSLNSGVYTVDYNY